MGPCRKTARLLGGMTPEDSVCAALEHIRNTTCRLGLGDVIPTTEKESECKTYNSNEMCVSRIIRLNLVKNSLQICNRDSRKYLPDWYVCLDRKLSL
jgi:hypothetical protein